MPRPGSHQRIWGSLCTSSNRAWVTMDLVWHYSQSHPKSETDCTSDPIKFTWYTKLFKIKSCFAENRTYHFQADDTVDMEEWISVLNNAKEAVLLKAFGESSGPDSSPLNQSVKELTRTIIGEIKRLPGNKQCCDCNAPGGLCLFILSTQTYFCSSVGRASDFWWKGSEFDSANCPSAQNLKWEHQWLPIGCALVPE